MTTTLLIPEFVPETVRRCRGKRAYRSMKVALKVAEQMTVKHHHLFLAYECPDCGKFHVGHANRQENEEFQRVASRKCKVCRSKIPLERIMSGARTCSKDCTNMARGVTGSESA